MTEKVIKEIVTPAINIALTLAILFTKKIALQKIMAVVELVTAVGNSINNLIKLFSAIEEYNEAKEDSFNNNQMLNSFTETIQKHLKFEKCQTYAEIAKNQKEIDNHRMILKELFRDNLKNNTIDMNNPVIKKEMSNIIDDVCLQDVNLCILLFNEKTLEFIKDEKEIDTFRKNLYYRITRSPISSISLARSEQDELTLLAMGNIY